MPPPAGARGHGFRRVSRPAALVAAAALASLSAPFLRARPPLPAIVLGTASGHGASGADAGGIAGGELKSFAAAVRAALSQAEALRAEVEARTVVRDFGKKAQRIVDNVVAIAGTQNADNLTSVVDGLLHPLFLHQVALLRERFRARFEGNRRPDAILERADRLFTAQAQALVRPGSDWSFEEDRRLLHDALVGLLRRDVALKEERLRATQAQRAAFDVIGKFRRQMETLGESLIGGGAGNEWVFRTSYRVPGTPFRVSGRYTSGRTNIEVTLAPDRDFANAEAGFVDGLLSHNIGLSLNLGMDVVVALRRRRHSSATPTGPSMPCSLHCMS
eukprot:CAMPEP_0117527514 /NCGR_PEP_ID=MMETSP0784-20121206/36839_1 /TAXON_ID=39447 /ORGANISM="" /LENGTH=331 /DNA_ID=CAMNT_0005323773 /DNA_START=8 /DNA_END=1001 /DNA_ORIENTATION=-